MGDRFVANEGNMSVDDLMGRFQGKGTWRDSAGNTGNYDAFLTNRSLDDRFEISQKHVSDGGTSQTTFALEQVAPFVYRVEVPDQDRGFGFVMNDLVRFYFDNHLGSITEIGYQAKAPGVLVAYGFTDRNSAGNYIMWHEELERVADAT